MYQVRFYSTLEERKKVPLRTTQATIYVPTPKDEDDEVIVEAVVTNFFNDGDEKALGQWYALTKAFELLADLGHHEHARLTAEDRGKIWNDFFQRSKAAQKLLTRNGR